MSEYAERDAEALDAAGGGLYCRHLNAMTAEGLHDKSDIAAELAFRDARIAELEAENKALREVVDIGKNFVSVPPDHPYWEALAALDKDGGK